MVKGETKGLSWDDILDKTDGGYDIYMYYLGKVRKSMKRPWGKKDNDPSWGIFPSYGVWKWKDHATEESGTAIQFVERMFSLNFKDALDKISWDFGFNTKVVNPSPVKVTWEKPDIERDYADIKFSDTIFREQHHNFWNLAEVSEDHCRKMNCFAVKDLAINGRRINIGRNEAVFAFYAPEEDAVKIYFPERREKRFKNNISYYYLYNYSNLQECENLIVQKSPKDMIVTTMITPCVTATNSEAIQIFNNRFGPTEVVEKINKISKTPWIWYGSDDDGVRICKEITGCNKWKYVNTPKPLLPEINDTYSYTAKFKLKGLEEFMRSKKLLK